MLSAAFLRATFKALLAFTSVCGEVLIGPRHGFATLPGMGISPVMVSHLQVTHNFRYYRQPLLLAAPPTSAPSNVTVKVAHAAAGSAVLPFKPALGRRQVFNDGHCYKNGTSSVTPSFFSVATPVAGDASEKNDTKELVMYSPRAEKNWPSTTWYSSFTGRSVAKILSWSFSLPHTTGLMVYGAHPRGVLASFVLSLMRGVLAVVVGGVLPRVIHQHIRKALGSFRDLQLNGAEDELLWRAVHTPLPIVDPNESAFFDSPEKELKFLSNTVLRRRRKLAMKARLKAAAAAAGLLSTPGTTPPGALPPGERPLTRKERQRANRKLGHGPAPQLNGEPSQQGPSLADAQPLDNSDAIASLYCGPRQTIPSPRTSPARAPSSRSPPASPADLVSALNIRIALVEANALASENRRAQPPVAGSPARYRPVHPLRS
ncbi:hypothetical protein BV22DRAFT_1046036 [Leucogyrophana mollusca]|uniref:Uncharacterized protein n=1 Tax=Leucogyrophana mollusca TaxID=85980 RepID=A0ACB8BMF5_9AGAM|nr:hypothetical protein BV22DRAFT_1046036 [Leucogyrophana mollusca]